QTMDSLRQALRRQQLPERMQQNAQQLRQGNFSGARREQQQMEQQLEQLAARLQQLEQQMEGTQRQINAAGLRQALRHILLLSESQEALRNDIQALRTEQAAAPMARRQEQLVQAPVSLPTRCASLPAAFPRWTGPCSRRPARRCRPWTRRSAH
ncbi:hypothetical protein, partial [Rhodothermus marinus]|uniref:hypothetical protein n=1 Tax=Rhodothermus marinus TaxID=29549 RepID=UPI001FB3728C